MAILMQLTYFIHKKYIYWKLSIKNAPSIFLLQYYIKYFNHMQAYIRTIYNTTQYHMASNNFDRSFVMLTQISKPEQLDNWSHTFQDIFRFI